MNISISRSCHDSVLSELSDLPFLSRNQSMLSDTWELEDLHSHKNAQRRIKLDFSQPILPGPILLTAPGHMHDLLTAKLYIYYACDRGLANTSMSISIRFRALIHMIRWRYGINIPTMNQLKPRHFDTFLDQMRSGGRDNHLPHEARLSEYLNNIKIGTECFPTRIYDNHAILSSNGVAQRLGLAHSHQLPSRQWQAIYAFIRDEKLDIGFHNYGPRKPLPSDRASLALTTSINLITPFRTLWAFRKQLSHDPMAAEVAPKHVSISSISKVASNALPGRTPLAPSTQVFHLVNSSLRIILELEHDINVLESSYREASIYFPIKQTDPIEIRRQKSKTHDDYVNLNAADSIDRIFLFFGIERQANLPCSYFKSSRSDGDFSLRSLIWLILPGACAIVISCFTARRHSEIVSLREDCLFENGGDDYLSVWIAKTLREIDHIPVPRCVVIAIRLLARLSETRRSRDGAGFIFQFADHRNTNVHFDLNGSLKAVADWSKVPPLPNGRAWNFTAHQMRTFFATVYFWRFEYPSLSCLSTFLRHFDRLMTEVYVTRAVEGKFLRLAEIRNQKSPRNAEAFIVKEAINSARERLNDFSTVQTHYISSIAERVALGEERLSGLGGKVWQLEIEGLVKDLSHKVFLGPDGQETSSFSAVLRDWASHKTINPHPAGHGYCKSSSSRADLESAACVQASGASADSAKAPDMRYATDLVCARCVQYVQRESVNLHYWQAAHNRAVQAAKHAGTAAQREVYGRRASDIEQHVIRTFGKGCLDDDQ